MSIHMHVHMLHNYNSPVVHSNMDGWIDDVGVYYLESTTVWKYKHTKYPIIQSRSAISFRRGTRFFPFHEIFLA